MPRSLARLVGTDNVVAPTLASLGSNFGLQPLIGKSLAIISDARLGARADQAAIAERLLAISGEDPVTIDRKHMLAWTGRLPTRFVILTNELPRLTDASGALASRMIVLLLTESFFGREDHGLADRLYGELPGILNVARRGFLRLRKRGHFIQPESAQEAIAELEALGSPVGAFIREQCNVGPAFEIEVELLFDRLAQAGAKRNGRKKHGTIPDVRARSARQAAWPENCPSTRRRRPASQVCRHRSEAMKTAPNDTKSEKVVRDGPRWSALTYAREKKTPAQKYPHNWVDRGPARTDFSPAPAGRR